MLKLNFDGATRGGSVASGGVIRDSKGNQKMDNVGNLGNVYNNVVKGMTLYQGLLLVVNIGWKALCMEGDSKLIVDLMKGCMKPSLAIVGIIGDIQHLLENLNAYEMKHTCKEGNVMTKMKASLGLHVQELRCWKNMTILPVDILTLKEKEKSNLCMGEWHVSISGFPIG